MLIRVSGLIEDPISEFMTDRKKKSRRNLSKESLRGNQSRLEFANPIKKRSIYTTTSRDSKCLPLTEVGMH